MPGINDPEANILLLVKEWLEAQKGSQWVMIVDNADDNELFFSQRKKVVSAVETHLASEDEKLAHYLPNCDNGYILFTSRNREAAVDLCQGRDPIEVPSMTANEAYKLLKAILPGEISTTETSALSSRLEHLPLALAQAASYILKSRTTIRSYIDLLDKGNSEFIDCLNEAFETVGRDSRASHAVATTWIISFEQIARNDVLASDILSFLSVLHYQAIPKTLIEYYYRSRYLTGNENSTSSALLKALHVLESFSFISEGTGQDIDMHRLVQLAMQKWLISKNRMAEYVRRAMIVVSDNFPPQNYATFQKYFPHAHYILGECGHNLETEYTAHASLLRQIMSYLLTNGHYSEILQELAEQLLEITQIAFGREHPNTAEPMMQLATVYRYRGRINEAEILITQALKLQQWAIGNEHPSTLESVHSLGLTYLHQGRLNEAEALFSYAFELRKKCWEAAIFAHLRV